MYGAANMHGRPPLALDFDRTPLLVIWEVTRSCALACKHCRASAIHRRDPLELSTKEGQALLDDVAGMGTPLVVFTGGDSLQRDDLEDLIRHAVSRGLRVGVIPAATPLLTRSRIRSIAQVGAEQIALSLDGASAASHDGLRGVAGTFDKVLNAAGWIRESGVALQINTVLGSWNALEFDAIADRVRRLGTAFWEVFFLVPTGRGADLTGCPPEECEILFSRLYHMAMEVPFVIKVTEAPAYRRFVMSQLPAGQPPPRKLMIGQVNSGKGFCFVDHQGLVCPSGFLPIPVGSVRDRPLSHWYREAPLFRQLRDPTQLKGRCGGCGAKDLCGGSRARAWAVHADPLAEDPDCRIAV